MPTKDLIELTSVYCMVSLSQWGANFIKYLKVSSIKSFVGIQLPQNYEMLVILGLLPIQGCM